MRLAAEARNARRWPLLLAALVVASCGAPLKLMTLPTGPGAPAPEAADALAAARAVCGRVSTFSAEVGVSGSVAGRRVPHGHLIVGFAAPASVRIEAPVPLGVTAFIFATRAGDTTLLLPRDNRVLEHGRPSDVLEALTGVPLDARGLRAALTGCDSAPDVGRARHLGDGWIAMPEPGGELYLARAKGVPWQIVAETHADRDGRSWRAEYHDFFNGLPRSIRLSADDPSRFDLALALSQVEINTSIDEAAFTVKVPASAVPMTLGELRDAGALQ